MTQNILFLHHSSLLVEDTQASLKFYCGVLGLKQLERPDFSYNGAWLDLGQQQLHLIELPNPDPKTGRPAHGGRDRHVAFYVRDLDVMIAALDKAGIPFTTSASGRRALFCRDRDSNALEFIEQPSS